MESSRQRKKHDMNQNSLDNLKKGHQWKPGESGNAKGQSLKLILDRELQRIPTVEVDGIDGKGETNAYWIVKKQVIDARRGDRSARQETWERTEGKVTQPIGGDKDNPIYLISVPSEQGKDDINRVINGERT